MVWVTEEAPAVVISTPSRPDHNCDSRVSDTAHWHQAVFVTLLSQHSSFLCSWLEVNRCERGGARQREEQGSGGKLLTRAVCLWLKQIPILSTWRQKKNLPANSSVGFMVLKPQDLYSEEQLWRAICRHYFLFWVCGNFFLTDFWLYSFCLIKCRSLGWALYARQMFLFKLRAVWVLQKRRAGRCRPVDGVRSLGTAPSVWSLQWCWCTPSQPRKRIWPSVAVRMGWRRRCTTPRCGAVMPKTSLAGWRRESAWVSPRIAWSDKLIVVVWHVSALNMACTENLKQMRCLIILSTVTCINLMWMVSWGVRSALYYSSELS